MVLKNFIFDKLPLYYLQNDSYKDSNNRGLLERFLEIFGIEIDDEISPLIDHYLDLIDPLNVPNKHISNLAYSVGNPPDMFQNNPDQYKKLLQFIVTLYKIKGTIESYKLFFNIMGFNVTIIEYPEEVEARFDSGNDLDTTYKFDTGCPTCSDYSLIINSLLSNPNNLCYVPTFAILNQTIISLITQVVKFLEPINAHLRDLINGGLVCEGISYCYQEDIDLKIIDSNTFDNGDILDNSELMDNPSVISTTSISQITCTSNLPINNPTYAAFDDSFTNATEFE